MILLIFTLAVFTHAGGTEGGIFDSPDQSYSSGCMGSLKVYQVQLKTDYHFSVAIAT